MTAPGEFTISPVRNYRGLSLVELLVATLLGLLLTAGVIALYLENKRSYFYDEQLARLQENGRYAIRLLSRELAMAGFFGGLLSPGQVVAGAVAGDCNAGRWALDLSAPLAMVDDHSSPDKLVTTEGTDLDCVEGGSVLPATDVLAIKRTAAEASLREGELAPNLSASTSERWFLRLQADAPPRWRKLKPVDLFALAESGNPASFWQAVARIFYIRPYSDPDNRDDGLPVLCMETLVGDAMGTRCLVEGVENLQLEWGIDTDGDDVANRYLSAPRSGELDRAVSARLYLLLRSIYPIAGHRDEKTYQLGKLRVPATGDSYLRRVFTATVYLRNRIRPIGLAQEGRNQ